MQEDMNDPNFLKSLAKELRAKADRAEARAQTVESAKLKAAAPECDCLIRTCWIAPPFCT